MDVGQLLSSVRRIPLIDLSSQLTNCTLTKSSIGFVLRVPMSKERCYVSVYGYICQ